MSMFYTLYGKLVAVLLVLCGLNAVGAVVGTLHVVNRYALESSQRLNRTLAAHLAEQNGIGGLADASLQSMRTLFDRQMRVNPAIQIYLLDSEGRVLAHAQPADAEVASQVALAPIQALLSADAKLPVLGEDPRHAGERRIFSVAPIPSEGPIQGYLYVVLANPAELGMGDALADSDTMRVTFTAALAGILVALAAGLVTFGLMTRKLTRLSDVVTRFQATDFSERPAFPPLPEGRADEIDRLGVALRDMSARLAAQVQKLKQTDVLRRELVANVSHDLKTPLATLQGYVDTLLLKEDILSGDERRNYLEIASRSCRRLTKLVSNLIELAKLDAHAVVPQVETFSAAELLQDVAQKFLLDARERRIDLRTELPEHPPYVCADIGLIERVLENLIGNALAHTDAGGKVRLVLEDREDHAVVKVSDTGSGIPPEELANIFDRFYRVEGPRWERGGSAGLGLAIGKSILELHGSALQVESKVGEGTSFAFVLPVARLEAVA
jgi:signal transduction histidine kinase